MWSRVWLAPLVLLVAGCLQSPRHLPAGACSSARTLRCLTPVQCAWDAREGCEICRCADAPVNPPAGRPSDPGQDPFAATPPPR